jgi:hypothetical protein
VTKKNSKIQYLRFVWVGRVFYSKRKELFSHVGWRCSYSYRAAMAWEIFNEEHKEKGNRKEKVQKRISTKSHCL